MQDTFCKLEQLKRPRFLLRTAKLGAAEYKRSQHLRRHFAGEATPSPSEALTRLMDLEAKVESQRQNAAATYSLIEHLDLLIAVLGEARLLRATQSETL